MAHAHHHHHPIGVPIISPTVPVPPPPPPPLSGGCGYAAVPCAPPAPPSGQLPFTGLEVFALVGFAVVLVALGLLTRYNERSR